MKKTIIYILITIIIISSFFFILRNYHLYSYQQKGNELIKEIYEYKKDNHKLPNSISDFKFYTEMGEGPYYEKLNDTTFIVYFNIGFDDQIIFNSNIKGWK